MVVVVSELLATCHQLSVVDTLLEIVHLAVQHEEQKFLAQFGSSLPREIVEFSVHLNRLVLLRGEVISQGLPIIHDTAN